MRFKHKSYKTSDFVPMNEHCGFKHLLQLPGCWPSHSSRLKWLLSCKSAVIMTQNNWYEYWYPLLRPFESFIPLENVALTNALNFDKVELCLRNYDDEVSKIADNGWNVVQSVSYKFHELYTKKVLIKYSKLLV